MEITQTSTIPSTTTSASTGADSSAISSDFDTFLQMLTVQVQNQDPLNPIESTDFAVQLATFSGVEQQVQTNDLLKQMVSDNSVAGLADLANWVGQEARTASFGYFGGSPVTIGAQVSPTATQAQLLVRDANGVEVSRKAIPISATTIQWDGTDTTGNPVADGTYRFDIVNLEAGVAVSEQPAEVYSRVVEVRFEEGTNKIIIEGGTSIPASEVTALREPSSAA